MLKKALSGGGKVLADIGSAGVKSTIEEQRQARLTAISNDYAVNRAKTADDQAVARAETATGVAEGVATAADERRVEAATVAHGRDIEKAQLTAKPGKFGDTLSGAQFKAQSDSLRSQITETTKALNETTGDPTRAAELQNRLSNLSSQLTALGTGKAAEQTPYVDTISEATADERKSAMSSLGLEESSWYESDLTEQQERSISDKIIENRGGAPVVATASPSKDDIRTQMNSLLAKGKPTAGPEAGMLTKDVSAEDPEIAKTAADYRRKASLKETPETGLLAAAKRTGGFSRGKGSDEWVSANYQSWVEKAKTGDTESIKNLQDQAERLPDSVLVDLIQAGILK